MSLFNTLTGVAKEPFIRKIVDTVDRYFFKDCSANETPFYEAYGIHGLGFSQLDDDFPGKPLVVIHNRDFLRLLVVNELSEVAISSDEMDSRITEMSQRRMRAMELYDQLIVLLRDTLSTTTNLSVPQEHVDLITKIKACSPEKLSIVTFNYDLLADRALRELDRSGKLIWGHRDGYGFKPANEWLPNPRSDTKLYKLHGSLNWYIESPSKRRETALNPNAPIHLPKPGPSKTAATWQRRQRVLGHSTKKAFPLMIPPVFEKGVQIRGKIGAVWKQAQEDLENATVVIVLATLPLSTACSRTRRLRRISLSSAFIAEPSV